jgi:hypothetical protein
VSAPDTASALDAGVPEWLGHAGVSVDVHVREQTVLRSVVHGGEGRVVLQVEGTNEVRVNLYIRRADLARLIDMASAAAAELDATAPAVSAA